MADGGEWQGRSLHLVGIGGAGMSGLARIALSLGAEVSGSDRSESAGVLQLRALGATIAIGHSEANVPDAAELVFSSAVPEDNPERARGRELGLSELHRSDLLGEMTRLRRTIAVTGTHGKTTTTAMVLSALRGAGIDAGWAVGADLAGGEANAGWGASEWFVVEADESDRSLLALDAEIAVLTNCELDHHATYSSLEDLRGTISQFLSRARTAVVWDREDLTRLVPGEVELIPYDAIGATSDAGGARFDWRGRSVNLAVPGVHNAVNAAGALTAASAAGGSEDGLIAGIEGFAGTGRRFEQVGRTADGVLVIDDYAHHPTEVAATIAAARSLGPGRVVAVFQPHLFSRTEAFATEFGEALATADTGVVADIYPAREHPDDFPGVDSELVVAAANRAAGGKGFARGGDLASTVRLVRGSLRAGDLCLLLGAGDVGMIARELIE